MVDCAERNGPPPPELRIALDCERWNTLPDSGGYLDQDYAMLSQMTAYINIYRVLTRMRTLQGAQIHQLTEGERKILRFLVDEGMIFHG